MNINEAIQLISNVGFPICACVFMYIQNTKTLEKMENTINELKVTITELTTYIKKKG